MSEPTPPGRTSLETVRARSVLPQDWRADFAVPALMDLRLPVLELLRLATSRLPEDVYAALLEARTEETDSRAANTLGTMIENVVLADAHVAPLCQDTGTLLFWVRHPFGFSQRRFKEQIRQAVVEGTARAWLRPNCVEALSGRNPGNNLDPFDGTHPVIHFEEWDQPGIRIDVMLKGGGCENVGAQYRLPDAALGAGRDLKGVRKCILDCVMKAQGQGCAPGILGVAIGGDRVVSYARSKELLLKDLTQSSPDPRLAEFETRMLEELNTLGIGPMGYGGKITVLGLFVEELWRHPASFFVSISYMCWSSRRMTLTIAPDGVVEYA